MTTTATNPSRFSLATVKRRAIQNIVPLLFTLLCGFGVVAAGMSGPFLANEIVTRLARNLFLVLSLIIPVVAGMGLNFGVVVGAMCGQVASSSSRTRSGGDSTRS